MYSLMRWGKRMEKRMMMAKSEPILSGHQESEYYLF